MRALKKGIARLPAGCKDKMRKATESLSEEYAIPASIVFNQTSKRGSGSDQGV